jgi:cell division protein FtsI (penicillin-binding protein 3)
MKPARDESARRRSFMRARVAFLGVILLGFAGAVVHRAFEIQIEHASGLREMAEDQYYRDIHLAPKRGSVLDRGGAELAISVDVDSVYANPRRLRAAGRQPEAVARQLAELLGVDATTIAERLRGDKHFAWIKRRVSPREGKAVRLLDLPGVELTREPRRFYPSRELAAHVLGFANIDGEGIEGIEKMLDTRLKGSAERVPALRDRRGVVVYSDQLVDERAARGDDVTLTLDKTIQHVTERELELAVRTFEAKAGSVVVLDPRNGEVLAMANYPTFNPNAPASFGSSHRRNRAITDRFEPGSTVKPFTVGAALSSGVVGSNRRIDCEQGAMKVAQYTIHDTHKWDELTPAEIIAYSSNIGTAKIGLELGRARLYRAFRDFGFGAPTTLGLPGEIAGHLRHHKRWYEMDAATIAFGQGMSVTALQLTVAMGSIANRGRLMHPTIVRSVADATGRTLEQATPKVERHVLPPHVAAALTEMMIGVATDGGTGVEAAVPGFLVAGKTGTAQKADYVRGGYAEDSWVSSFVGFVPARKPRLVISVTIDEPVIAHHGGTVAAPVFRRIAEASLRHLGVVGMPVVHEETVASSKAKKAAAKAEAAAEAAASVALALAAAVPEAPLADGERRVPDLLGKTARQALVAARARELQLVLSGTGLVASQIPAAGEVVKAGGTVSAQLAPPVHEVAKPAAAAGLDAPPAAADAATSTGALLRPTQPQREARASRVREGRDG